MISRDTRTSYQESLLPFECKWYKNPQNILCIELKALYKTINKKREQRHKVNDNHVCKYPKEAVLKLHKNSLIILLHVCPSLEVIVPTSHDLEPKTKRGRAKQNWVMFHHITHITKTRHKYSYYNKTLEITRYLENKIRSVIVKVFILVITKFDDSEREAK